MALPGHRRTSSHKRRRASHFALQAERLSSCPQCGQAARPHHACLFCGTYRGRTVFVKKAETKKREHKH